MSVEEQYINLYKQHAGTIEKNSAGALNDARKAAFERFSKRGFPTKKDEEYLYTDIANSFAPDYGMNINAVDFNVNPYSSAHKYSVPGLNNRIYFVVNDQFYDKEQQPKAAPLPDGVIACSLKKAAAEHKDIVDKYYGKAAKDSKDGSVDFNTTFAEDGFFLYVPKGVKIPYPIQLVTLMTSNIDQLATCRNLIVIEDGAEAKLIDSIFAQNDHKFLANRVTEIFVGKGAKYEHYKVENTRSDMTNLSHIFMELEENSEALVNELTLQNGLTRNNVEVNFRGKNANLDLCGMAICDGEQHTDTDTLVNHWEGGCTTNELYKYVLDGKSTGCFSGTIMVAQDAQKTKAIQTNKNICLNKEARMYTRPHLEIYADDVICNHGATVGQLNNEEIFYLRSRGIPEPVAKMLLMFAFVNDVEEKIMIPELKDAIRMMVERKFRGEIESTCKGCASISACHS